MPIYNYGKLGILDGTIALGSGAGGDTIKVMAVNSTYTFSADHQYIDMGGASDPVDCRIGNTTDQTLANKAQAVDLTNDRAYFDADDISYAAPTSGQTIEGLIVYKDTGTATTSPLIAYFDVSQLCNGGQINVAWAAPASGGLFYIG